MTAPLVPCPECSRHVRAVERTCPFCASALPDEKAMFARAIPGVPAGRRLDRFAVFTFATAVSVAACSGTVTDDGGVHAEYGAPAIDAGHEDTGSPQAMYGMPYDAGRDVGQPMPAYGLPFDGGPPPVDAASDAKADAEGIDAGGAVLYGLPPPDSGLFD